VPAPRLKWNLGGTRTSSLRGRGPRRCDNGSGRVHQGCDDQASETVESLHVTPPFMCTPTATLPLVNVACSRKMSSQRVRECERRSERTTDRSRPTDPTLKDRIARFLRQLALDEEALRGE
jgi:hypothetical protein